MKFYLIDDDKNILNILKIIIHERNLGEVCGIAQCGSDALEDFAQIRPDIVIVDLLMDEMDGLTLVKRARTILPDTAFIMLSQVSSKDMIAGAYEAGVEFYIQKPINSVEVEAVIRKVCDSLQASRTLQKVQTIFGSGAVAEPIPDEAEKAYVKKLKDILKELGIMNEKGSRDIITVIDYLISNGESSDDITLNQLCGMYSDNPKSMEQRIRRAASLGMSNLAHLGIEDYANDTFMTYSNSLYSFVQIRHEMDYIRGKSPKRGNVKIKKFLNGLIYACNVQ